MSFTESNINDLVRTLLDLSISTCNFCKYNQNLKRNKAQKEARRYNLVETRNSKNSPIECPNSEVIRYKL